MTFEAAKTKLTQLKEQITRHNTNIKKYNDKKSNYNINSVFFSGFLWKKGRSKIYRT